MARYGGARITYSPTYLEFETKQITGDSGIDDQGNAVGTTSILLLSNYFTQHPVKDFEATITFKNIKFTRIPTGNLWEGCLWFIFSAPVNGKDKPFNYLSFKTGPDGWGLEGGTAFDSVGQKFWPMPQTTVWPFGTPATVKVRKLGQRVTVWNNGVQIYDATITLDKFYNVPGTIGLYTEDGFVGVSQVDVVPL